MTVKEYLIDFLLVYDEFEGGPDKVRCLVAPKHSSPRGLWLRQPAAVGNNGLEHLKHI